MGYLTTLTIYNDGIDLIKEYPEEFASKVCEASFSHEIKTLPLGGFCNLVKVQKTRHADSPTVYVHCGNTVCEMNPYSDETIEIMKRSPAFFEKLLKEMHRNYKVLSKQFKQEKESKSA